MILILHENATELAKMLDDTQLDKQIRAIAKILNQFNGFMKYELDDEWSKWVRTCRANYLKLVEIGVACCREWIFRFSDDEFERVENIDNIHKAYLHLYNPHKLQPVIEFARDNVPELPTDNEEPDGYACTFHNGTPIPAAIPKKFITCYFVEEAIILSYIAYYRALLQKRIKIKTSKRCFKHDCCIYAEKGYCIRQNIMPLWTRRSIPDFLADLVR